MCGVVAISRHPGADLSLQPLLEAMIHTQKHRGPDHQGVLCDEAGDNGLAHARLAILDLSHEADQPMVSNDGMLSVVFNGEIYNWKALRELLVSHGLGPFRTQSDTEVLLEAYRHFGDQLPIHLSGMFAFAILDKRDGRIFCARDRVGKKPLLYSKTPQGIVLSSEIPARRLMPDYSAELNQSALASMLLHNMRHIPDPDTVYADTSRLRPGHAMTIRKGEIERIWRYWDPQQREKHVTTGDLRQAIERAVELRMVADVPVGALLSGGVDSTAVVALMTKHTSEPVHTYALGMNQDDEDLRRARSVAEQLGCEHREFYFDGDRQFEIYRKILRTYGEPISLLPLIHSYELSEAIQKDGIKVALVGHGADELFYGYSGHARTAMLTEILRRLEPAAPLARLVPSRWRRGPLALLAEKPGLRKAALYRGYEASHWQSVVRKEAIPRLTNGAARECEYWGALLKNPPYIDESNFIALMMENAHSVTTSADLPAMMASVEMRAPFLDQEVVELALNIPFREKVPNFNDLSRLKYALKLAVEDLVPQELLYAPKRGFGHGIQEKDVLLGPWREIADKVFSGAVDADGLFDTRAIRTIWREQKAGREQVTWSFIAKLFSTQLWLQELRC